MNVLIYFVLFLSVMMSSLSEAKEGIPTREVGMSFIYGQGDPKLGPNYRLEAPYALKLGLHGAHHSLSTIMDFPVGAWGMFSLDDSYNFQIGGSLGITERFSFKLGGGMGLNYYDFATEQTSPQYLAIKPVYGFIGSFGFSYTLESGYILGGMITTKFEPSLSVGVGF